MKQITNGTVSGKRRVVSAYFANRSAHVRVIFDRLRATAHYKKRFRCQFEIPYKLDYYPGVIIQRTTQLLSIFRIDYNPMGL